MQLAIILTYFVLFFQQTPPGLPKKPAPPPPSLGMKLFAATDAVKPGGEVEIAIEFEVPKPWHVYHPIIVDSGFATTVQFRGPAGVTVENLRWPTPSLESIGDIEYLEL